MSFGAVLSGISGIASAFGGGGGSAKRHANHWNRVAREDMYHFAENGIKIRVDDAKRSGIHPIYALGASTPQSTASYQVGGGSSDGLSRLGAAGQNIGRALHATSTDRQRQEAFADAQLENSELQNELLRSQIAQINSARNPAFPSPDSNLLLDGQGDSTGTTQLQPSQIISNQPGKKGQESGSFTDYGFVRTPNGYAVVPSADSKQRIEDQLIPELSWAARNLIVPNESKSPPKSWLPKGYDRWRFNMFTSEWVPAKTRFKIPYTDKVIVY